MLPAMAPQTNGALNNALTVTKAAWARCAATVDMIADCQARIDAQDASASDAAP